jgi:hypothetical protein
VNEADLIVRNAKVTTLHDAGMAEALAVRGELPAHQWELVYEWPAD